MFIAEPKVTLKIGVAVALKGLSIVQRCFKDASDTSTTKCAQVAQSAAQV